MTKKGTSSVNDMREWLSGGASPCQGEGRGFDSRLALFLCLKIDANICILELLKLHTKDLR